VRALLALPEVLVLDEVGDDMSVQDLLEMHKVLVAYLEYKIPGVDDTETCKLLRKVTNVPRTIIGLDLRELYNRTWTRRTSCSSSKTLRRLSSHPPTVHGKKKENFVT